MLIGPNSVPITTGQWAVRAQELVGGDRSGDLGRDTDGGPARSRHRQGAMP